MVPTSISTAFRGRGATIRAAQPVVCTATRPLQVISIPQTEAFPKPAIIPAPIKYNFTIERGRPRWPFLQPVPGKEQPMSYYQRKLKKGVFKVLGLIKPWELQEILDFISSHATFSEKIQTSYNDAIVTRVNRKQFPHDTEILGRIEALVRKEGLFPGCVPQIVKWRVQNGSVNGLPHQDKQIPTCKGRLAIHLAFNGSSLRHIDFHDTENNRVVAQLALDPMQAEGYIMTSEVAQKAPKGGPENLINHSVRAAGGDIIISLIIDFVERKD